MTENKTDAVSVETSKVTKLWPVVVGTLSFLAGSIPHCDYFQTSQKVEKTVGTLAPAKSRVTKLEERIKTKADSTNVAVLRNDVKHLGKKVDGVQRKVEKLQSTVLNGFYQIQQTLQKRAAIRPRAMPGHRYRKRVYTRPRR